MELETDDPEKGELLQRSAHHREALEEEVKFITERTEKILTNALIIGGALTLTYLLVRGVSSSTPEKKKTKTRKVRLVEGGAAEDEASEAAPEAPGIVSQIGTVIAAQATGLLLSIAREKLVEFLHAHYGVKKEAAHDRS